ncbi:uncharacterized protein LOC115075983 [Rhinatrema bivittatum]|uniref:uncharacterized protein LOC115075983 n=1 Tax=Rhinatrema bivittatum TaxID=194408 RepID=UPI00112B3955|nr:uncharacterized protein LOC115075983 [Rhinatrema bivittatum]XP_029432864.1 uncharacterized protein LOC115075983 [Rhinatrema bivittatum]
MFLRNLKVAILVLISCSTFFILLCIVTDNWLSVRDFDGTEVEHWGLWRFCNRNGCFSTTGGGYTKALLIVGLIVSFVSILLAGLELKYGANGTLGCLKVMAVLNISVAVVELFGMVVGSFIFLVKGLYSWSYILGWMAFSTAAIAGAISLYNHLIEPAEPAGEVKVEAGVITVLPAGAESEALPPAELPPAYEPQMYKEPAPSAPHPETRNDVATLTPVTVA